MIDNLRKRKRVHNDIIITFSLCHKSEILELLSRKNVDFRICSKNKLVCCHDSRGVDCTMHVQGTN